MCVFGPILGTCVFRRIIAHYMCHTPVLQKTRESFLSCFFSLQLGQLLPLEINLIFTNVIENPPF